MNDTLSATGLVMARNVTPVNVLATAKTATAGEFHSDGRILAADIEKRRLSRRSVATSEY